MCERGVQKRWSSTAKLQLGYGNSQAASSVKADWMMHLALETPTWTSSRDSHGHASRHAPIALQCQMGMYYLIVYILDSHRFVHRNALACTCEDACSGQCWRCGGW